MNKKVVSLLLAAAMAFSVTACGGDTSDSKKEESEESEQSETTDKEISPMDVVGMDLSEYVTLGEYKNLKLELTGDYSNDEEALNKYIESMLTATYEEDKTQDTVKEDSIVNVDYVGKKDGVAFDGGSAESVNIDVAGNKEAGGQGGYIDGFTSGLPGAKVGDVIDCDVTFPENYGSAELAGQAVVFTFTINYICKEVKMTPEELTDEYVSANFGKETVDEFKLYAQQSMESDHETAKESEMRGLIMDEVDKNSKVEKYPDGIIDDRLAEYNAQFEQNLSDGQTLEEYVKEQYDMELDEFNEKSKEAIEENLKTELIFLAIAQKENIGVVESEFEDYAQNMSTYYGLSTKEDLYLKYGSSKETGRQYLMRIFLCNEVLDKLLDYAKEVNK